MIIVYWLFLADDDIKKVLQEVGCEVNAEELSKTTEALRGKQLHELIAAGSKKLANVSFGSGAGASTQAAASGSSTQNAPAKEEKKAEPKKEEEADVGLGGDLFGDEW